MQRVVPRRQLQAHPQEGLRCCQPPRWRRLLPLVRVEQMAGCLRKGTAPYLVDIVEGLDSAQPPACHRVDVLGAKCHLEDAQSSAVSAIDTVSFDLVQEVSQINERKN